MHFLLPSKTFHSLSSKLAIIVLLTSVLAQGFIFYLFIYSLLFLILIANTICPSRHISFSVAGDFICCFGNAPYILTGKKSHTFYQNDSLYLCHLDKKLFINIFWNQIMLCYLQISVLVSQISILIQLIDDNVS